MSTFKQLQRKSSISSSPATRTRSFLQASRPFAPLSTAASEQAPPVTQARFDQGARFGHSLDRISILPPASRDTYGQKTGQATAIDPANQSAPPSASMPSVQFPLETTLAEDHLNSEHTPRLGYSFANIPLFPKVQRKAFLASPLEEENQLGSRIQAARSNGHPLDKQVQQRLEQELGVQLPGVRIHTNAQADSLSRAVNATAFTTGADIFFRSGAYNPGTLQGMHLLTHEATHAVQQAQGPVAGRQLMGGISISDPSDRFEQAAEKSASRIVTAQAISPTGLGKPVPKRIVPIGSHTPQTVVVQRVPFPPLPENFETLGEGQHAVFEQYLIALLVKLRDELNKHNYILGKPDEPEHTKYKNSMDTIKIQKDKIDVMIGEVELFIYWHVELRKGIGPKDQKQLRSLIVDVNKLKELKDLAPSAPSSQNKDESLTKGEEAQLKIMLNAARDRIIQSLKQEEKLSLAFGKDSEATAKDNFQKIIYHLEFWKKQPQTRVRIKRSMGEYAALNHGFGGGSILWLGVNFFNKEDMEKNVGILIHEASHGSVGTKDHAYIGDPHFHVLQTIPSNLALDNADHYKYAVALAFGEAIGPEQSTEGVSNEEHMLGAARTLAFYKSRKIVEFAIWMHDHYMRMHDPATKGLGTLEPETIFLHADLLSLTEVKLPQLWPTLAVHASTLLKVFNSCLSYFKSNLKFTLSHISNNNFEMTINIPIDVQLDNTITDASLDEISNAMLKALVRKTFELPEPIASKLIDVGEQLLNHRFEIGREQNIYHIDENDINLHSRLKAGNTRSRSASKESISTGKYRFL